MKLKTIKDWMRKNWIGGSIILFIFLFSAFVTANEIATAINTGQTSVQFATNTWLTKIGILGYFAFKGYTYYMLIIAPLSAIFGNVYIPIVIGSVLSFALGAFAQSAIRRMFRNKW